ncbi:hypothetical protein [Kordia sp.]|uniref:hypothetical protein n=1 Tax=Kordia sp. TaxID=1965332 RepID=UPI003B5C94F3
MKKRNIKSLQLNKESISNMEVNLPIGGRDSNNRQCYSENVGTCYWLDCPFPQTRYRTLCCE